MNTMRSLNSNQTSLFLVKFRLEELNQKKFNMQAQLNDRIFRK